MGSRIPDFRVEPECSVFVIVDEYGEYVEPYAHRVFTSMKDAQEACDRLMAEAMDNYDGPDDDPTEGVGYCANH